VTGSAGEEGRKRNVYENPKVSGVLRSNIQGPRVACRLKYGKYINRSVQCLNTI